MRFALERDRTGEIHCSDRAVEIHRRRDVGLVAVGFETRKGFLLVVYRFTFCFLKKENDN